MSAATLLPEGQYRFLAEMLAMEIFQENYTPSTIDFKHNVIKEIHKQRSSASNEQKKMIEAAKRLEIKEEDLRPLTPAEQEEFKRKLRKIKLTRATSKLADSANKK